MLIHDRWWSFDNSVAPADSSKRLSPFRQIPVTKVSPRSVATGPSLVRMHTIAVSLVFDPPVVRPMSVFSSAKQPPSFPPNCQTLSCSTVHGSVVFWEIQSPVIALHEYFEFIKEAVNLSVNAVYNV